MYERHFGLVRKPFDLRPDPSFMYFAERHVTALRMLEYGLFNHDGFTVITGEVGCGKTTVMRYLVDRLNADVSVGIIENTHTAFGNMMQWALMAFGLDFKKPTLAELYDAFASFVLAEQRRGHRVLLIVDEAQNLDTRNLEALRVLSNINSGGGQTLHTALIGQPELRDTLRRPELRQVRQRIAVSFHLAPLTPSETDGYVSRRLELAGGSDRLFEPGCTAIVHHFSGGIPRLINVICDAALVYAFGAEASSVGVDTVRKVIRDRCDSGILPVVTGAKPVVRRSI